MEVTMKARKNIILLALITGSLVTSSYSSSVLNSNTSLNLLYEVSPNAIVTEDVSVIESEINVPIFDEMVPQGLTFTDDYFLVSAYDYYKNNDSCIIVLDKKGNLINVCSLNNKAHVGGISYNRDNNLLWVTGEFGNINVYDFESIINSDNSSPIYSDLDVGKGLINYRNPFLNSVSFLTVYDNRLFIGNFSLNNQGFIKEYEIFIDDETNELVLNYIRKFAIPDKVQGVSFYSLNNNEYIIFSRSYGRNISSVLQVYSYDKTIDDYRDPSLKSVSLELPAMLEQTTIIDGSVYSLYESCAIPYRRKNYEQINNLMITNIDDVIKKLTK